jgi:FkbM family methyltransferase
MKRILTRLIRRLATISSLLKLDLMWRITCCLSLNDRRSLLFRLYRKEEELITFRRDGALWTGFTWDSDITWDLFANGIRHKPEIEALLSWMRWHGRITETRRTVIDVGANIGTSSIPIAQLEDCSVIAVEPVPENFAMLRQNVRQNGLEDRIDCRQVAISDVQGKAKMVLLDCRSGGSEVLHPVSRPVFTRDEKIRATIEIETDTLDHLVQSCGISPDQVSFIWSDTQGHEGFVIRSAGALWNAGVPLYVEIEPALLHAQNSLALLQDGANAFFHSFIEAQELIKFGNTAKPRPISELPELIQQLMQSPDGINVLLIPNNSSQ